MNPTQGSSLLHVLWIAFYASSMIATSSAFGLGTTAKNCPLFSSSCQKTSSFSTKTSSTSLASTAAGNNNKNTAATKKPYVPKWVKKETLASSAGDTTSLGYGGVGLKGSIPVVFKQGNETKTSMAWAGQPIRDVASQAGQYIQYGCGKGECGTCECMMNGKWVRPCVETVPANAIEESADGQLVLQIKAIKAKTTSSGTFFSFKSFFMGFWNNILGMLGMVKFRKKANDNWGERKAYEDLVAQKTLQKKLAKKNENGGNAAPGMA